jgi:hypothetical protein
MTDSPIVAYVLAVLNEMMGRGGLIDENVNRAQLMS